MTITNTIASVLEDFTATQAICSALGATFTFGTNLFINYKQDTTADNLTIKSYGGGEPNTDKYRYNPSVQFILETSSNRTGENTMQACIETFHMHGLGGKGLMKSKNSAPIILGRPEGGQKLVCVSNYEIKYIKQ